MNKLISVIIVNFNGEKYLETCLSSVLKRQDSNFELIVVDDGSIDKSLEIIKKFQKKNKKIHLIKNQINLGAAASRNRAIKSAKGEIFVFLDNDTKVTKGWLKDLIKPILRDKKIAGVQALLLDYQKRKLIQMAGGQLIRQTAWLAPFYQGQKYKEVKSQLSEFPIAAVSAALAVKAEAAKEVNGFDEKEAVYTEDLDFSWRLWLAGYKIVLAPKAIVYHWTKSLKERGKNSGREREIYFHLAKNSFRSIMKNYSFDNAVEYLLASIAINILRGLLRLIKRGGARALIGTFQAIGWNVFYLSNTLAQRKIIQKKRKVDDGFILENIMTKQSLLEIYRSSLFPRPTSLPRGSGRLAGVPQASQPSSF